MTAVLYTAVSYIRICRCTDGVIKVTLTSARARDLSLSQSCPFSTRQLRPRPPGQPPRRHRRRRRPSSCPAARAPRPETRRKQKSSIDIESKRRAGVAIEMWFRRTRIEHTGYIHRTHGVSSWATRIYRHVTLCPKKCKDHLELSGI